VTDGQTDRQTDRQPDGIAMAYTRYSIYAVARKNDPTCIVLATYVGRNSLLFNLLASQNSLNIVNVNRHNTDVCCLFFTISDKLNDNFVPTIEIIELSFIGL